MTAFRAAVELGAGIECDVRLTGDGQVVIFHDHDLRRMCASALAIESTGAAMLAGQKLFDSSEHIPPLGELLDLAAGRVPLLIELKCRSGNAVRLARAVADQLAHYAGPAGVMSFEARAIRWFARNVPGQRRGLVISRRATGLDRWGGILKAAPHFLAIDCGAIAMPWAAKQRQRRWVYSWTIRSPAERQTAAIHADAIIWEGDGRPGS